MRRAILVVLLLVFVGSAAWWWWSSSREPEELAEIELDDAESLGTRSVTLYFGTADADGVRGETRTIQARMHRDEEVEIVLDELLDGPTQRGLVSAFPEGTRLRQVFFDDSRRLLYLDFSQELVAGLPGGSATELMVLQSVMRTVAVGFPDIEAVQILVDGLEVETLSGHVDLTHPLRPGEWL